MFNFLTSPILAQLNDPGAYYSNLADGFMSYDMSFFYENLADVCTRTSDILQMLMFVLIFVGALQQAYKGMMGGDLGGVFRHFLISGLIIAIMPFYAEWMLGAQSMLGNDLLAALEIDPISSLTSFGKKFGESPFDTGSAPDIVFGIIDPFTWFEYFAKLAAAFIMMVLCTVMYVFFWIGFQVQIIAIYLGCAGAPIFLGMLVFEQTRDTGTKYHVGMIAMCFWPLGWGLGMLFAEAVLDSGAELFDSIMGPVAMMSWYSFAFSGLGFIIIVLIVLIWLIVTLFVAPKVVSKAITTGANIGMGIVSGGASVAMSTATAGIQAASGAAMMAGGAALTATGAGAAVGVGMMAGGAGSMGGAAASMGKATQAGG